MTNIYEGGSIINLPFKTFLALSKSISLKNVLLSAECFK